MRKANSALLLLIWTAVSAVAEGIECGPLSNAEPPLPANRVEVMSLLFTTGGDQPMSTTSATLVNHFSKPITSVFLMVELQDDRGDPYVATPLVAAISGQRQTRPKDIAFGVRSEKLLESAIQPGADVRIAGTSEYAVDTCPAQFTISMIRVKFADSTVFSWSAPRWFVPADVRSAKALNLSTFPRGLPAQVAATLSIAVDGRVAGVQSEGGDGAVVEWLRGQLRTWSFYPAIDTGVAKRADVTCIFRIHKDFDLGAPWSLVDHPANTKTLTITVDIYPKGSDDQVINAGGVPLLSARSSH